MQLRAFVLAGASALCLAAVASAQDIPTGATLSCPSGKIYIESCNIRDTSDNSTCLVGHPDTVGPNGLMKYTNETRGNLKSMLPSCQKAAPAQANTANQSNPAQSAASTSPAASQAATSMTMKSVSIKNSPGVPDLGGHSIIGGLFRGSLTAVEPNLFLCVTPAGGRRTCTAVCPPGHDCARPLGGGIFINSAEPSVHLDVMDNDGQGHITTLGAVNITNATMCTQSQPCTETFPDSTSPDPAHGTDSTIYFEFGVVKSKCDGPYVSVGAAMMSSPYGLEALNDTVGDVEHGFVIVRDPSNKTGGYYAAPPVESTATNDQGTSLMSIDDYKRSWAECQAYTLAATVHTHPESLSFHFSLTNPVVLKPFNSNFTAPDFAQSIDLKIAKNRTAEDDQNGRCLPKDLKPVLGSFEEIVMIYVGDRMVRTFKPKAGDCSWPVKVMQNLTTLPIGTGSIAYWNYVWRTCILPWEYKEGQGLTPATQTEALPAKQNAYLECKEDEE